MAKKQTLLGSIEGMFTGEANSTEKKTKKRKKSKKTKAKKAVKDR